MKIMETKEVMRTDIPGSVAVSDTSEAGPSTSKTNNTLHSSLAYTENSTFA